MYCCISASAVAPNVTRRRNDGVLVIVRIHVDGVLVRKVLVESHELCQIAIIDLLITTPDDILSMEMECPSK